MVSAPSSIIIIIIIVVVIIVQDKTRTGYKTEQGLTDGVGNKQSSIQLINNEGKTSISITTQNIKTKIM